MFGQGKGKGKGGKGKAPPQNLQVLSPDSFREMMPVFVASLGLADQGGCFFCHVQGNFAADDKDEKKMARKMIMMVRDINANTFNGEQEVTCFTCHRGSPHPLTEPE